MRIIFKRDCSNLKNPHHIKKKIFIIYSPRTVTVEPATCSKIDTDIVLIIPENAKEFITPKFRKDNIFEINTETQRLWLKY